MNRFTGTGLGLLLALALPAAGCAAGPAVHHDEQVRSDLDPSRLFLGVTVSDMTMVRDGERLPLGSAVSSVEQSSLGARPVLRFVLTQRTPAGTMSDTLDVEPETLRPVRYRNAFGDRQSVRTDYGPDGRVVATTVRDGVTSTVDTVLTRPHFDGSSFQALIAALPLADGYVARIPVFHYDRGASTVGVRVVGRGVVEQGGGERPVWTVEYEATPGQRAILSVDQETGQTWRVTSEVGPAARFEQVAR